MSRLKKWNRKSLKICLYRNWESVYDKENIPVCGETIQYVVLEKLEPQLHKQMHQLVQMVGLFLNDNYLNIESQTMRVLDKHIGESSPWSDWYFNNCAHLGISEKGTGKFNSKKQASQKPQEH